MIYVKIKLYGILPFYIYTNLDIDIINDYIYSFEKERAIYGIRRLNLKEKIALKDKFASGLGVNIAFDTPIDFELYKQGRNRKWLQRYLSDRGVDVEYQSLCRILRGVSTEKYNEIFKLRANALLIID